MKSATVSVSAKVAARLLTLEIPAQRFFVFTMIALPFDRHPSYPRGAGCQRRLPVYPRTTAFSPRPFSLDLGRMFGFAITVPQSHTRARDWNRVMPVSGARSFA